LPAGFFAGNSESRQGVKGSHAKEELNAAFWNYLPITLFLCVPGFALILKILYRQKDKSYLTHLLFSFHLQTVVFAVIIVATLLTVLAPLLITVSG
jgi:uncharacterized membrane protein